MTKIEKLVPQDKDNDTAGSGGGLVLASSKGEVNAETVNAAAAQAVRPVQQQVVRVEHLPATPIKGVGRQVWRGSLLLADYLLHHHSEVYRYAYLWVLLQLIRQTKTHCGAGLCLFSKFVLSIM